MGHEEEKGLNVLQLEMFADNPSYDAFVDKFKPKKTTDDCYTPQNVYDAIADWVAEEYHADRARFLRPFYPGGDYTREEYPPHVVTAATIYQLTKNGIDFRVPKEECTKIYKLDAQRPAGKAIFGGGFLLSERLAAAAAAAEKGAVYWELSDREKRIVRRLGGEHGDGAADS